MRDVEGLCAQVIHRSALKLSHHEYEDLLAYLLSVTWELSESFDAERTGKQFSGFALHVLRLRIIDFQRSRNGRSVWKFSDRTYERPRPQLVSLDAPNPNGDSLVDALPGGSLDDSQSRLADELRALKARGRRPGRGDDWMGDEAA